MNATPPVTFTADANGVGWIVFDDRDTRANVFTVAMQNAFAAALDEVEHRPTLKAVVLQSGKERIFIAGADLGALAQLPNAAAATEFSRRGQRLFQRVADSPVPIVCAIHGACAGGGFELALACSWRIASEDTSTQIGLPETSIGTIPGWGGSVRLPRLIGVRPALDHLLKGQLAGARAAWETGLVNDIVPPSDLSAQAALIALQLAAKGR